MSHRAHIGAPVFLTVRDEAFLNQNTLRGHCLSTGEVNKVVVIRHLVEIYSCVQRTFFVFVQQGQSSAVCACFLVIRQVIVFKFAFVAWRQVTGLCTQLETPARDDFRVQGHVFVWSNIQVVRDCHFKSAVGHSAKRGWQKSAFAPVGGGERKVRCAQYGHVLKYHLRATGTTHFSSLVNFQRIGSDIPITLIRGTRVWHIAYRVVRVFKRQR